MIPFRFGNAHLNLHLPAGVLDAMLPSFIHSFEGDLLPSFKADVRLSPLSDMPGDARDCTGQGGFRYASMHRREDDWTFGVQLPFGPTRPDDLPTRCVLPALACVLAAHSVLALHASAVEIRGGAVLFVGRSGAGKSTSAAELARRGCNFLADDRVLLWPGQEQVLAAASYEQPNPFARWADRTPETGTPPPPRRSSRLGIALPVAHVLFVEVNGESESNITGLSGAAAYALLGTSAAAGLPSALVPLPPAARLTLGRAASRIFDCIAEGIFTGEV